MCPWGILRKKENANSFNLFPLIKPSRFPGQRSTSPCLPPDIRHEGFGMAETRIFLFFYGKVRSVHFEEGLW